jgi:DNA-directed RNA polymerase subunit RPC12/RpoP
MKPTLHFFCEKCEESFSLRVDADSFPRCPHCRRYSLVLVKSPGGAPVTPDVARRAFAAMHQAIEQPETST